MIRQSVYDKMCQNLQPKVEPKMLYPKFCGEIIPWIFKKYLKWLGYPFRKFCFYKEYLDVSTGQTPKE